MGEIGTEVRGRLFDVVANRALLFLALTALGVVAYVLVVAVAGPEVPARGANAVLLGAALAATMLTFRTWAQRGVDWLLYGQRADPDGALVRLSRRIESDPGQDHIVDVLATALQDSLRLDYVAVTLLEPPTSSVRGAPTRRHAELPLLHQGRQLGTVVAGRRGEKVSRSDERVLAGFASQLAAAAEALRLNQHLQHARERVVRAHEEERRRLHRDLHDVLGPALAGVALGLDTVRSRARRDPAGADELVVQIQGEVRDCVGEVRRIIDGLRPPALDERGLVGALEHQAHVFGRHAPQAEVSVEYDELPPLPAAVEAAAYLIAQEALTNAVRHAGASAITVSLSTYDDRELVLAVRDDGAGFDAAATNGTGVGLASMAARAEELGGTFLAESAPGSTVIAAHLPLDPVPA